MRGCKHAAKVWGIQVSLEPAQWTSKQDKIYLNDSMNYVIISVLSAGQVSSQQL